MNDKKSRNRFLSTILAFAVSGISLVYLYRSIDIEKAIEIFRAAHLQFIFYAFFISCLTMLFLLFRWLLFLWALGIKIPTLSVVRYFCIGLFGNPILPSSIGGDVIKVLGLCRFTDEKAKVVASVLLDRISGFIGMIVVAFSAFLVGFRLLNDFFLLIVILGMAVLASLILAVLFIEPIYAFFVCWSGRLPKLKNSLMQMHYDMTLLKDQKHIFFKAIAISVLGQVVCSYCYYLLSIGLLQDVRLFYFLIFLPLISMASAVPSIGGLGVREWVITILLAKIGVAKEISVNLGFLNYIFMVVIGLIGGFIFVVSQSFETKWQKTS